MKILFLATVSNSVVFVERQIEYLLDKGHIVGIACKVSSPISQTLIERGVKVHDLEFSRKPINVSNLSALISLKKIIIAEKYSIVHTLTPIASAAVRLIKLWNKDLVIIYTAHGFHFFKGAPLINWLIYFPTEKLLSYVTDYLITINEEDFKFAKDHFRTKRNKVVFVHGAGLELHDLVIHNAERSKKRKELRIDQDAILLVSVGELNENKNHSLVLEALNRINSPNVHYIICGSGPLSESLHLLAKRLGIENRVHLLGYRSDVSEVLTASDVFILPSKREGLSVALMEAMSVGLPVICSNIRGNRDLIQGGIGGYLFEANNVQSLITSLNQMLSEDTGFMGCNNLRKVQGYSNEIVIEEMSEVYRVAIDSAVNKRK